jgi:inositol hexakisphosphate/diphosphoinositol-pentakisphosphate kinase
MADNNSIRRDSSYIYERFMSTEGFDIKVRRKTKEKEKKKRKRTQTKKKMLIGFSVDAQVYSVGTDYFHAEGRKAPVLDGRVLRDETGKVRLQQT